jgi:DNA-binding response OmpR family regulator
MVVRAGRVTIFPKVGVKSVENVLSEDHAMNETIQPAGDKKLILIVEDNSTQAVYLKRILEKDGYEVVRACDGIEALDLLEAQRPALIISDVMMPALDGYTFCQRVKSSEKFRSVPFMLLTTLSEPLDIFKGLGSGADYYKIKPYDGSRMLERVRNILSTNDIPSPANQSSDLDITYGGKKYSISAGRGQILDLLLATFENIVRKNNELVETNHKLTEALEANKTLRGLIPICGYCKKIRDDRGFWNQVESFVARYSEAKFSHGICPQCFDKAVKEMESKGQPAAAETTECNHH